MPAITVCSTAFTLLGKKQLKALGCEDHPLALIPHPFGLRTREQVRGIAEKCVDDIARIAIDPQAGTPARGKTAKTAGAARAGRIEVPEDADEFDRFCIDRRWSDGLPLHPPTLDRVERMIAASGRAADDIVAVVQPGFGTATVEGIAINAVMAGCRPEYMRTLIAAVQAFTDPRFNLQGIQATSFDKNDSTVTIVGAAGTVNFNTHAKDASDLLKVFADSICFPTNNDYYFGGEPWLLIGPEHAEILHSEGLRKRDVKLKLWEMSRLPVDRLAAKDRMRLQHTRGAELGQFDAKTTIPISIKPEEVSIIVAGGPGTHSVHVPTFGHTRSVTRRIV